MKQTRTSNERYFGISPVCICSGIRSARARRRVFANGDTACGDCVHPQIPRVELCRDDSGCNCSARLLATIRPSDLL